MILATSKNTPFRWSKSKSVVSKVASRIEAVAAIHKSFLPMFRELKADKDVAIGAGPIKYPGLVLLEFQL